jgi:hypothetical protein
MGEPEKVEGLGLSLSSAIPAGCCEPAKLDDSGLPGLQLQPKECQSLPKIRQETLGIEAMLESHDEVIRVADHDHLSPRLAFPPSPDPEIQHVMQVDIGQKRTDAAALDRPHLTARPLPLLQHTSPQPLPDESPDAPVPYAVLDELHQPSLVEGIEKPPDVRIEHPAHLPRRDPHRERIERIVRAPTRSESVREAEEFLLVNGVQHLPDGPLDDLVLQSRKPDRPRAAIRPRYVRPAHRSCSVRLPPQPIRKIPEVPLQILSVAAPCLPVDPRGCLSLKAPICLPETLLLADMVVKRSEPLPPIPLGCLPYPLQRT